MDPEYTLIDCATGLVYGPYQTPYKARHTAEGMATWEILDDRDELVDCGRAKAKRGMGRDEPALSRMGN
jgi:hypothetical protein